MSINGNLKKKLINLIILYHAYFEFLRLKKN